MPNPEGHVETLSHRTTKSIATKMLLLVKGGQYER